MCSMVAPYPSVRSGCGGVSGRAGRRRRQVLERRERPGVGDLVRRREEPAPRGAGERAADADPADAEVGGLGDGDERCVDQQVDRLGRHRGDDGGDLLDGRRSAGRRGSRRRPRRTPAAGGSSRRGRDGRRRSPPSGRSAARRCRCRRSPAARRGSGRRPGRSRAAARPRRPRSPRSRARRSRSRRPSVTFGRDQLRVDGEATLEVGVDGHGDGRGDGSQVVEHLVERDLVVRRGPASRPSRRSSSRAPGSPAAPGRGRCRRPTGSASRSTRSRAGGGTR